MSHLLDQAIAEARKLPEAAQDALAALILAEIEDDRRWEEAFAFRQRSSWPLQQTPRSNCVQVAAALPASTSFKGVETMPPRKPKKPTPANRRPEPTAELREALTKQKKADLVAVLLELAQADRSLLRQLNARFDVAAAPTKLVAATRQAIADATAFDPREMNHNFDYDDAAYGEVKQNLTRLIAAGQLRPAMRLALELMEQGSHQVEMSDEGLMTDDIEDCLSVLLKPLAKCELPAAELIAWCSAMLEGDRVGFIAREPLQSLRNRLQEAAR